MGYGARKPGFKQATQKKFVKRVGQTRLNDAHGTRGAMSREFSLRNPGKQTENYAGSAI
jgi:hypothetical protein